MLNRLALGLGLAGALFAGPPLTMVQDILYRADGSRFNGILQVQWSSFEASDRSNVPMHSMTVRVTDGNLVVRLVPTTTASPTSYYNVKYNSEGRTQFEEMWAVPETQQAVRVRDVRITAPVSAKAPSPIEQTDVIGLTAELSARPVKGPGYMPGRAAVINAEGALEGAIGNSSDCIRVDGTSGPCGGGSAANFVDAEAPAGLVDGANAGFGLTGLPSPPTSLQLYRNGVLQKAGFDYALNGSEIQFVAEATPQPGDTLLASYRTESGGGIAATMTSTGIQVVCGAAGSTTNSDQWSPLGTCAIPASSLGTGDRIELRFDLENSGAAAAFDFQVLWGATMLLHRSGGAAARNFTGRIEASIDASGAQWSATSWGTGLDFAAATGFAPDAMKDGISVQFRGRSQDAAAGLLRLTGFSVIRYPAH
jgi:hypothetical protein